MVIGVFRKQKRGKIRVAGKTYPEKVMGFTFMPVGGREHS